MTEGPDPGGYYGDGQDDYVAFDRFGQEMLMKMDVEPNEGTQ
jgi:hypothetical protein